LINAAEGRGDDAVKEHDEIMRALTTGDAPAAMLAMREHIDSRCSVLKCCSTPGSQPL
jgi:DNA-binding GntR family transcriptional regulator